MCRLLETMLCADGHLQNTVYHQRRLDAAFCELFPGSEPFSLADSIKVPQDKTAGQYRVRAVYDRELISVEFLPVMPRRFMSFLLVLNDTIEYPFKYEDRTELNKISDIKGSADEVIIVKNGYITDSTISNLLFFDGKQWCTSNTPLLKGTMRQLLLDKGLCIEKQITLADISDYERILLVNAVLGFHPENAAPISGILNYGCY